jgi:hypothetical protein
MLTRADRRAANKAAHLERSAERGRPGSLAGRYTGPNREFTVTWLADVGGYRRDFEKDSRWTWDEARTWSTVDVLAELQAGRWRLLRRATGP